MEKNPAGKGEKENEVILQITTATGFTQILLQQLN